MTAPERSEATDQESGGGDANRSPLPPGRHSLSREFVRSNQEGRLIDAAGRALLERNYAELAVSHITEAARISRATFYQIFDGKRDCVLAAHRVAGDRLTRHVEAACEGLETWPEKVAAGVGEGLRFVDDSPQEARLLIVHALGADAQLTAEVLASQERLIELMEQGRAVTGGSSELIDRALLGGFISIVAEHLIAGDTKRLLELEPQLVELMLMPHLGGPTDPREGLRAAA